MFGRRKSMRKEKTLPGNGRAGNGVIYLHYTVGGIVQAIKGRYSLQDALQEAGVKVGRNKKALCLWHNDRSPSMHVYREKVHCFACGRGGDAIDVFAAANGLETKAAVQALAARFGFKDGIQPSAIEEWHRRQWQMQSERETEKEIEAAYWGLCRLLRRLEDNMKVILPDREATEDEAASKAAARIGALLSDVWAVLDGLASENQQEQRQALQIAKERGLLT